VTLFRYSAVMVTCATILLKKMMRDAKITQIYEGTNQIQRSIIGGAIIKEALRRK